MDNAGQPIRDHSWQAESQSTVAICVPATSARRRYLTVRQCDPGRFPAVCCRNQHRIGGRRNSRKPFTDLGFELDAKRPGKVQLNALGSTAGGHVGAKLADIILPGRPPRKSAQIFVEFERSHFFDVKPFRTERVSLFGGAATPMHRAANARFGWLR